MSIKRGGGQKSEEVVVFRTVNLLLRGGTEVAKEAKNRMDVLAVYKSSHADCRILSCLLLLPIANF